jgi:translation initiation factor 3 subunit G
VFVAHRDISTLFYKDKMSSFSAKGKTVSKAQWVDEDEEEFETPIDQNGFKQRVKMSVNAKGQKVKTTTKIRVREVKTRTPQRVLDRRDLAKFGQATLNNTNVTLISPDFVTIEHPDEQLTEDTDDPAMGNSLISFILKQKERALERENDMGISFPSSGAGAEASAGAEEGGASTGKYVPPNMSKSGGASMMMGGKSDRDHENTLRVSNLTKRVTEDDLRELFSHYGRVFRVSLPRVEKKDDFGNIYKEPRGFAYIAFTTRQDAEIAMDKLQGHGYDHLILKLEWAKPPSGDGPGGGGGGAERPQFRSGYGEKLAQETKEQVSFASNLTGNTY